MRIWHQSVSILQNMGGYPAFIEQHLKKVAREDVEVVLHGIEPGTYTSMNPRDHVGYIYIQNVNKEQFIRNAMRAEREGYDAFFIATIPDIGFEEIRTLVDIPVVGFGQSSFLAAAMLGRKVGVVNFNVRAAEQITRNCVLYGLDHLLGPFVTMDFQLTDILQAYQNPEPLKEAFTLAVKEAVAQGAEVIIPGAGPLNVLLAELGVSRVEDVPVIDSMGVGVKFCEMRADLYKSSGLKPSRQGLYNAQPPAELVSHMRGLYYKEP
ncbi:MAG TPA: aspartate/glutamate racemase family protein [Trebonia sp.]|jgi:Asp/Glu/hydantoin racemase|nr:aspartate/glutamate racemase family protein [Trebonia sp.]